MINIDERITEPLDAWDWDVPLAERAEVIQGIKQLIQDVLEEVKPQRIQVEPNTDVLRAYQNGANDVVGEMETNIKDLGL